MTHHSEVLDMILEEFNVILFRDLDFVMLSWYTFNGFKVILRTIKDSSL